MSDSRLEEKSSNPVRILRDQLPCLPYQMDLADLKANGKLLDDDEIARLERTMQEMPEGRYSKKDPNLKDLNLKYGIVKLNGEYYAVYKGMKHNKHIAFGSSAKIKLVQSLKTGSSYALKRFWRLEEMQQKEIDSLQEKTVNILSDTDIANAINIATFRHTRTMQYDFPSEYDILRTLGKTNAPFFGRPASMAPTQANHILMELVQGMELFVMFCQDYKLSSRRRLDIAISALENALYIQGHRMLHRDFKAENLIYDPLKNQATWIDFGFTKKLKKDANAFSSKLLMGTQDYLAPELYNSKRIYNEATEVYALGILMGELFGCAINTIAGKKYHMTSPDILLLDPQYKDLIDLVSSMTFHDPKERPTIKQVYDLFKITRAKFIKSNVTEVGMIDIDEYLQSNKSGFHSVLASVDEVLLVTKDPDIKDEKIIQVMRDLSAAKVMLVNKVLYVPSMQPFPVIPPAAKDKDIIYSYKYFTPGNWIGITTITPTPTLLPISTYYYGLQFFSNIKTTFNDALTKRTEGTPNERFTF